MRIDIWSDIVCPFCYIGKRELERALASFEHADQVEIVWRSFELDPTAPAHPRGDLASLIGAKYGLTPEQAVASQEQVAARAESVGLTFAWRTAQYANTFDAHRLVHHARAHGLDRELYERLLSAYFAESLLVSDRDVLTRLAVEVGLDEVEVRAMLEGDDHADAVRADEAQARSLGIGGVPFFVFDGRLAVSGAQPTEVFTQALERAWAEASTLQVVADGASCGVDGICG